MFTLQCTKEKVDVANCKVAVGYDGGRPILRTLNTNPKLTKMLNLMRDLTADPNVVTQ